MFWVVATDFTGAKEQLKYRSNSVVVGMFPKDICAGIVFALSQGEVEGNMHFDNDMEKFTQLLS